MLARHVNCLVPCLACQIVSAVAVISLLPHVKRFTLGMLCGAVLSQNNTVNWNISSDDTLQQAFLNYMQAPKLLPDGSILWYWHTAASFRDLPNSCVVSANAASPGDNKKLFLAGVITFGAAAVLAAVVLALFYVPKTRAWRRMTSGGKQQWQQQGIKQKQVDAATAEQSQHAGWVLGTAVEGRTTGPVHYHHNDHGSVVVRPGTPTMMYREGETPRPVSPRTASAMLEGQYSQALPEAFYAAGYEEQANLSGGNTQQAGGAAGGGAGHSSSSPGEPARVNTASKKGAAAAWSKSAAGGSPHVASCSITRGSTAHSGQPLPGTGVVPQFGGNAARGSTRDEIPANLRRSSSTFGDTLQAAFVTLARLSSGSRNAMEAATIQEMLDMYADHEDHSHNADVSAGQQQ